MQGHSEKRKVSVVQIIADGKPGGGTTAVLGLMEDLAKKGDWDLSLIARDSYATNAANSLGASTRSFDFLGSRLNFTRPARLGRVISGMKPALVHVHGNTAAHDVLHPLCNFGPAPVVYTNHGLHFLHASNPRRLIGSILERSISRKASQVCYVSHADMALSEKHGFVAKDTRRAVIYNGVDPTDFDFSPVASPTHDLVFIGRLVPQKNPLFILKVLSLLKAHNVSLLMVGGGELESEIRSSIVTLELQNQVTLTGALNRESALAAIQRGKIFIFPSLWEGLPIGPIEAMFGKVPIVASNIEGTSELIKNGEDGVLVDRFEPQVYADIILRLLLDPAKRHALAGAALKKAKVSYVRSVNSDRYHEIYNRLISLPG